MDTEKSTLRELFETLDRRPRPEEVADLVRKALGLTGRVANKASRYNLWSSMSDDFARPPGMDHSLSVAGELFGLEIPERFDLRGIDRFIADAEEFLKIVSGKTDFKYDRLNKESRKAAGLDLSKRQYNKRFRLAARMTEKRSKLGVELEKREFQQVSKSKLAFRIRWEDFQDPNTACFVAYYASKCNKRSTFTNTAQERPYDELCDQLFRMCENSNTTNWWAISHVYPDEKVLRRLGDEQKGVLLGYWFDVLYRLSGLLKVTWEKSDINRQTMIVKRGNDSSTWNVMAGAWNRARDGWIATIYAMGIESILDDLCVGKVLRLMAADVAYWHRATGGKLEPDTAVWCEVPLPWEVLSGYVSCTRSQVEEICSRYEVDPVKKGWTSPKKGGTIHAFKPTPELVHGVEVSCPYFARILKKMGAFSGKTK